MKAKKPSIFLILTVLCLAALLLISCAPAQQGDIQDNSPSPSADMATDEPTGEPSEEPTAEITKNPNITPEATAAPRLDCPAAEELNEHDYNAVRAFLELKDENGVRNGEKLNETYDPDDPATWFYYQPFPESVYDITPIADWDEGHRLSNFSTLGAETSEFIGELDLSNCKDLKKIYCGDGIKEVNITGCNDIVSIWIYGSGVKNIYPETIDVQRFTILNCPIRQLHWKAVPGEENINVYDFDLRLTADGAGYVGVRDENGTDYLEIHIKAYPEEGHKFVGWYDQDGNLISTEESYEITSFETATHFTGTFDYIARFE